MYSKGNVLWKYIRDEMLQDLNHQIRSDQISRSVVSDSLRPHESQHARPPCPSPIPGKLVLSHSIWSAWKYNLVMAGEWASCIWWVTIMLLQFLCCSVSKSCPTLCNPMDCSMPGFPVFHCLPEFAQTHVHWVDDTMEPSHPLLPPSPPALSLSQHQGLFQSHQVAKVLELQLQHQSFQ